MKSKKFLAMVMSLAMVGTLLAGCGGSSASSAGDTSIDEKYTLKMHFTVAATDPVGLAAQRFADSISEDTNGNITVELYPSSSLGNTSDCLEGLSMRACDIVYNSVPDVAAFSEIANIDAAPYLYSDIEHYRTVWEGEVGDAICEAVKKDTDGKLTLLGGGLGGVRVLTSNIPVYGVADVKGLKMRVPTIPIYLDTWTWLGAAPTPLPPAELFTALQQHTVDAQENPYTSSVSLSLHEVCDYVTETNHVYSTYTFIMDTAFLESLPAAYQEAIRNAADEASVYLTDTYLALHDEKKQDFIDAGAEIIKTDVSEWQTALDGFLEEKYPALVEYAEMIKAADPNK